MRKNKNIMWTVLIFLLVLLVVLLFWQQITQKVESNQMSMELTKTEIIQIARKALKDEVGLDVDQYKVTYDSDNKKWNKHYADRYSDLGGRNYQAVYFTPTDLQIGGGPHWVCIDKQTGEVLQFDIGL